MQADPIEDQRQAAIAEVAAWAEKLSKNPPPGTRMGPVTDLSDNPVTQAIKTRLEDGGPMNVCCDEVFRPAPTYFIPRHYLVLCVKHWNGLSLCTCCIECDACRIPLTDRGHLVYLFMGATIVQSIICLSCLDRL